MPQSAAMVRTSSPPSSTALGPVAPISANQVTNASGTSETQHSAVPLSDDLRVAHSGSHYPKSKAENKQLVQIGGRKNSLRRVKDSNEVLRQRSYKAQQAGSVVNAPTAPRQGRQYTVGNIGTGGVIYLRPGARRSNNNPPSHVTSFPLTPPKSAPLPNGNDEKTYWNISRESDEAERPITPSSSTPRRSTASAKRSLEYPLRPRQVKAYSFSSVDDHKSLLAGNTGTVRIIINRPPSPTQLEPPQSFSLPTLRVPIPHYKLGTPRFSTHGTPMLRSSAYSRTSAAPTDSIRTSKLSQPEFVFPAPPNALDMRPMRFPISASQAKLNAYNGESNPHQSFILYPSDTQDVVSVTPDIYDRLAKSQDDPSVVRYIQDTQTISAATPARIVAEISSESFMDYDLVSDFFLTFRNYMSTMSLLDLLLARLRWAVDRMTDDGRVIRIRTFAAIRHWILNYFQDDFVPYRELRMRFCEGINTLYAEVRARTRPSRSDLKILQDLKRCWNGRCSLYWDSPYFAIDTNADADIIPGGVVGSRNSELDYVAWKPLPNLPDDRFSVAIVSKPEQERLNGNARMNVQAGVQTTQLHALPGSPGSQLSVQPTSCSLPLPLAHWNHLSKVRSFASHGPSVQTRRLKAPANLAVQTHALMHRRNARSMDSSREPTPVTPGQATLVEPSIGSIIRGQVYPPASAIVQVLPSMSISTYSHLDLHGLAQTHARANSQGIPSTRSVFGSIRKALGTNRGTDDPTVLAISDVHNHGTLRGKLFTKPVSTTKSNDDSRIMRDARPVKTQMRVDLLCAAVAETYEAICSADHGDSHNDQLPQHNHEAPITQQGSFLRPATPPATRSSHDTAQSGSILIVDGTGLGFPLESEALPTSTIMPGVPRERTYSPGKTDGETNSKFATHKPSKASGDAVIKAPVDAGEYHNLYPIHNKSMSADVPSRMQSAVPSTSDLVNYTTYDHEEDARDDTSSASSSTVHKAHATLLVPPKLSEYDAEEGGAPVVVPSKTLRRRPGGDLKTTNHVHDLESTAHHKSIDSLSMGIDSAGGSLVIMGNRTSDASNVETPNQKAVSMINTHSSQHLRPSFEAAISGFSAIPDDDDGGLEATLAKLEGKYEKLSPELESSAISGDMSPTDIEHINADANPQSPTKRQNRSHHVQEDAQMLFDHALTAGQSQPVTTETPQSVNDNHITHGLGLYHHSVTIPRDSGDMVPLLERGLNAESVTDHAQRPESKRLTALRSVPQPELAESQGPNSSSENVDTTVCMEQVARPWTAEPSSAQSFLLDEDENLSDLSSEISVDIINQSDIIQRPFSPMTAAPGTARSGLDLPSHPLGHPSGLSEPIKLYDTATQFDAHMVSGMPLTPDASPVQKYIDNPGSKEGFGWDTVAHCQPAVLTSPASAHIPFVLGCDSQVLAQQFTLVEREALNEVEWIDLVEMRWDNKAADIHDWAEYLSTTAHSGIDLVVTRFNIVVKWVLSEIMLTQNTNERACVIAKFIHTAAHARRLHNYATMLQITIALTSTDCSRLTKTWELVPAPDRSVLKNMESLVQPVRNFHDLRSEMESANLTDGCIPFIGLYVHDLTYNAQKPALVAGIGGSEPLVNFERFRTAAVIVKGLLRLIDASTKYAFAPVEGIIDRCLWMAALTDDKIRELSKALEVST